MEAEMADDTFPGWHGTTIIGVKKGGEVVIAGDGRVDCWMRDWNEPLNMNRTGYFGSEKDGGFAEYAKIDHKNVKAVDSDMTDAELATFSCSSTTAEGMLNRAQVGGR